MKVEEEYEDVLKNLELAIVQVYQQHSDLIDLEVRSGVEWLIRIYNAEAQGKSVSSRPIRGIAKEVAESVRTICELWLGRAQGEKGQVVEISTITPDVILACLKRIQNSIEFWTKERGRQGYLDFISEFFPK